MISIIAALGERNRVIGRDNDLPWRNPADPGKRLALKPDMARFKQLTIGHPIVMGRATWESIPEPYRPLPDRTNIVVTTKDMHFEGALTSHSLCGALERAEHFPGNEEIFIIGGQQLYERGLRHAHRLYLTLVDQDVEGDRFFPDYSAFSKVISREVVSDFVVPLTFLTLERS